MLGLDCVMSVFIKKPRALTGFWGISLSIKRIRLVQGADVLRQDANVFVA